MKFAEFFFRIRDETDDSTLFDYEVIADWIGQRQILELPIYDIKIKDVDIDHDNKKIRLTLD